MERVEKKNRKVKGKKREPITGFGLLILGIFIFLSLITFSVEDTASVAYNNWGGVVGHILSYHLYKYLGIGSYVVSLLSLLWGIAFIFVERKRKFAYNSLSIAGVTLLLQVTVVHFLKIKIFGVFSPGGIMGEFIHEFLVFYTGRTGTLLILLFLYVLMLLLILDVNLREILKKVPKIKKEKEVVAPTPEPREKPKEEIEIKEVKERELELLPEIKDYLSIPLEKYEISEREIKEKAKILKKKLKEFGIEGEVVSIITGPVITRYEFNPAPGVKVSKVTSFEKDLALALKAERIRILAPIPGKSAIGIEIPNEHRKTVYLGEIVKSSLFEQSKEPLTFALGVTITGEPYIYSLAEIPHVLIAGTTGSGKSVCIHSLITSMIIREPPERLRFIMMDPKRLELPVYNLLPHLLSPVVMDPKKAVPALEMVIKIMEARYKEFSRENVRDIQSYNEKFSSSKKPYIVVIVDELADLMLTAPSEVERCIIRLAQMSRAVGIHLVLATQRPSVDVITGLIKANFPGRIAFQVASKTDSRTILDMNGAEALLGKGDMLFLPPGKGEPLRLHGALVTREEVKKITEHAGFTRILSLLSPLIKNPRKIANIILSEGLFEAVIFSEDPIYSEKKEKLVNLIGEKAYELLKNEYYPPLPEIEVIKEEEKRKEKRPEITDPLFVEAAKLVISHGEASVSMLQRRLRIGYARAGYIIDQLERAGIVGPYEGSKSRKVLVEREEELAKILKNLRIE